MRSLYIHPRSRRRVSGDRGEGGYPNFLLHLADGCLNPEIASASFKITHRCPRSYHPVFVISSSSRGAQSLFLPPPPGGRRRTETAVLHVDSGRTISPSNGVRLYSTYRIRLPNSIGGERRSLEVARGFSRKFRPRDVKETLNNCPKARPLKGNLF